METGDKITLGVRRCIKPRNMTVGKTYTVLEYDANTGSPWPSGSMGEPFVTIYNDVGKRATMLASRFDKYSPTLN